MTRCGMRLALALAAAAGVAVAASAGPAPRIYQATGPIVELTDTKIVIDKGKDGKWEIARDAATKVTGVLKVGARVTVEYRMTATAISAK